MLKRFCIALTLTIFSTQANAVHYVDQKTWAASPLNGRGLCLQNNAGGSIILMPGATAKNGVHIAPALSTTDRGQVLRGVWNTLGQDSVIIAWSDGQTSMFSNTSFQPCIY